MTMSRVFLSADPALLDIKGCFQCFANINSPVVGILKPQELYTFLIISLETIPGHKATVSKGVHFFFKALVNICDMCILAFSFCSNTTFPPTFQGPEWSAVGVVWQSGGAVRLSWRVWEGKLEEASGGIQEDEQMFTWEFTVRGFGAWKV